MINLAGDKKCDARIREELFVVGVPIVQLLAPLNHEVPASLVGQLGNLSFTRAWYYWVINGPVPLAMAEEMYADPIGKKDIRVSGHCACPPPAEWVTWIHDEDGKEVISEEALRGEGCSQEVIDRIKKSDKYMIIELDADTEKVAKPYITTYHIDSFSGLKIFVDTAKKYGLDKKEKKEGS